MHDRLAPPDFDGLEVGAKRELGVRRGREDVGERSTQQTVFDDVPEIGLADVRAVELERRTRGVFAFPDVHAAIRTGAPRRDGVPRPEPLEQLLRRARQGVDAQVHFARTPLRQSARF